MPRITKPIIRAGKFLVRGKDGERRWETFDTARLARISNTSNAMVAAGLKIPGPFRHLKEAVPITVNEGAPSYDNGGYWDSFYVGKDEKGREAVFGVFDAPGSIDDKESSYYKAMNTNKEVSISLTDNFTDGNSQTWTDGLMHCALVNHAVMPDQQGFKDFSDGMEVINMSMVEDDDPTLQQGVMSDIRAALLANFKVVVPETSSIAKFLDYLKVALMQTPSQGGDNNLETHPIYMSIEGAEMQLDQSQAEALVASKTVNPVTKAPFTMEDLGFAKKVETPVVAPPVTKEAPDEASKILLRAMAKRLATNIKETITSRINALIASGKIDQEYANKELLPKVGFNMSIVDGADGEKDLAAHPLETVLSIIEAQPALATKKGANDTTFEDNPFADSGAVDQAEIDKELDDIFKEFQV